VHKRSLLEPLVIVLSPFAPFLSEELWDNLGHKESVHRQDYPAFDEKYLIEDEKEYPVCINGKKRLTKAYPMDMNRDDLGKDALEIPEIKKWLSDKTVLKVIVVPGKMINIVVK
jgi:leucyl-tRNA synthetase